VRGLDRVLQDGIRTIEEDEQVQLGVAAAPDRPREVTELDEEKPLRKAEVLLKQPVPLEGARPVGQERVVVVEPDGPDRASRDRLAPRGVRAGRTGQHAERLPEDLLVEVVGQLSFAPDVDGKG
jgi:hypothetical protein